MKRKNLSRVQLRSIGTRQHVVRATTVSDYLAASGANAPIGGFPVVTIDGKSCRTVDTFHTTIARAMQFPDYYGGNLSALEDCFFDVRLRKDTSLILAITHSVELFRDEVATYKEGLLDAFENIGIEWNEPMMEPVQRKPQVFVCLLL